MSDYTWTIVPRYGITHDVLRHLSRFGPLCKAEGRWLLFLERSQLSLISYYWALGPLELLLYPLWWGLRITQRRMVAPLLRWMRRHHFLEVEDQYEWRYRDFFSCLWFTPSGRRKAAAREARELDRDRELWDLRHQIKQAEIMSGILSEVRSRLETR